MARHTAKSHKIRKVEILVIQIFNLDLKDLDVNMFAAMNNSLINDGCGLYRGRLILPYEHLSRFQNDLID